VNRRDMRGLFFFGRTVLKPVASIYSIRGFDLQHQGKCSSCRVESFFNCRSRGTSSGSFPIQKPFLPREPQIELQRPVLAVLPTASSPV
jgi:hypothetical protein